jgi:hypothetical protein
MLTLNAAQFYLRTIFTMWVIVSARMLLYLDLMQYVIAPQIPDTQVCSGFVRDQDLLKIVEGRFIAVRGETLFVHNIACQQH